nr:hypothetical protein [uncultured bacterium]
MTSNTPGAPWPSAPAAASQLDVSKGLITSLSAGLIIHRVGQVAYGFAEEARGFSRELQRYMNTRLSSDATTLVYEEVLGQYGRMHWLVHMKTPSDYGRLLHMVDHDKAFQEIYQGNRLPERGGGNWERIFVQGSFRENVMVPQHGFAKESMDELEPGRFVPPARHQLAPTGQPHLDSSSAGALVLRTVQARYESRDLARYYLYEWQSYVNKAAPGIITAALFEEIWGSQDKLHVALHLRSLDDYQRLHQLETQDEGLKQLMAKPRVSLAGQPTGWGGLFANATMTDTVLLPLPPPRA